MPIITYWIEIDIVISSTQTDNYRYDDHAHGLMQA